MSQTTYQALLKPWLQPTLHSLSLTRPNPICRKCWRILSTLDINKPRPPHERHSPEFSIEPVPLHREQHINVIQTHTDE